MTSPRWLASLLIFSRAFMLAPSARGLVCTRSSNMFRPEAVKKAQAKLSGSSATHISGRDRDDRQGTGARPGSVAAEKRGGDQFPRRPPRQ